jgi:DNA-binding LacI/PurR family transcriptional regulator
MMANRNWIVQHHRRNLPVEKVTIATVARHARVSRQTVSNVLNAPHLVREQTQQRVREAIDSLGYRANQAARQMRTGRSQLIAVRIEPTRDGINGTVLDRFLHGLTEAATPAGYRVVLYTATDDAAEIDTYDELLAAYDLDAFVLTSTHHGDIRTAWLAERRVPFVTFGRPWGEPDDHPWVDVEGASGTSAATERLLAAGHRRIGFLGWPAGSGVGDDRRAGWERAVRRGGGDPAGLAWAVPDGVHEGERITAERLARADRPTALVCASDSLAVGALRAARTAGVDLAVIGFDDTPVAQAVGLTSVSQPLAEAAARCVDLVARQLDGGEATPAEQVLLQPDLIVRQSG